MDTSPLVGQPPHGLPPDRDALALVEHLASRISDRTRARTVLQGIDRFRRLDPVEQQRQLPGTYLVLEHYLLQLDPGSQVRREDLHREVGRRFPELLAAPAFALLFEDDGRQEVLLCRQLLRPLLEQAQELLGSHAHPSLAAIGRWLDGLTKPAAEGHDDAPTRDGEGWLALLTRLGHDLFEQLRDFLGEEAARELFERQYQEVAGQYLGLSTFPAVIRLFPPQLLDESKIELLSRSQTRRVLMDKLEDLQAANRQLQENNADLQMALEVLERGNEELERRVEERTRELGESEERFRLIASSAKDAILMVDPAGRVTYLNGAAEQMFGYGRDELLAERVADKVIPTRFRERYGRAFRDAVETGRGAIVGHTGEFVARRRDGVEFPVELSISSVKIDGQWHLVGMLRDISQRKREEEHRRRLEEQIGETQRLESLGVLTGGLAHDFNNLLTTILGNVGLMESLLGSDFTLAANLRDIHVAAQRAADLTHQMLAYSGRGQFLVETLDLRQLVGEVGELLRASVSKRAVLDYQFADDVPAIQADRSQVQQVVVNLVTNASDALEDRDGRIVISTELIEVDRGFLERCQLGRELAVGTYVCLRVSDDGVGMEEEQLGRIFEPFYSTKFTGRGLGLAAVLGIVRGHQGAIHVRSRTGEGTDLRVLFPPAASVAAPAREPAAGQGAEPWTGGGTVLVVDDEPAVRFLACAVLEEFGFDVVAAEDGLRAVEIFRRRGDEIDVVLLDLTMPNMDGEQALAAIQELRPEARILLCSGYGRQETMERFTGRWVAGFVHKPYEVSTLVGEVRRVLGASGGGSPGSAAGATE